MKSYIAQLIFWTLVVCGVIDGLAGNWGLMASFAVLAGFEYALYLYCKKPVDD